MWVQELFTELKKLAPLLRCDVAKLGPKRGFRGICIGNTQNKTDFQNLKMLITFGQNTQISPFLAKLQTKMKQKICWKQIFHILTFFGFLTGFRSDFLKFSRF